MSATAGAPAGGDVGSSMLPPAEWWWQGLSGGRERSAFPLPLLATKSLISTWHNSQKYRRRLSVRLTLNEELNRMIVALNVLYVGGPGQTSIRLPAPTVIADIPSAPFLSQRRVLLFIRECLVDTRCDCFTLTHPTPKAALGELLRERAGHYSMTARGAVTAFVPGAVSWKKSSVSVELMDLVPDDLKRKVNYSFMLRDDDDRVFRL